MSDQVKEGQIKSENGDCRVFFHSAGILVQEQGGGSILNNEIFENMYAGIALKGGSTPKVKYNRVYHGQDVGIWIMEEAYGEVSENWIFGHFVQELKIDEGSFTLVSENHIEE